MGLGAACDGESDRDLHLSSNELVLLPLGWECHCFAMRVHSQEGDSRSQTQL